MSKANNHRVNQTRVDLVVTFGKEFDQHSAAGDASAMQRLADWAQEQGLSDCARRAAEAAKRLQQGQKPSNGGLAREMLYG